jgi:F-type H+-transporting ATPase subunit delta
VPDRRRAWAQALFLAAPDLESRAAFAEALEGLRLAVERDRPIRNFLSDPSVPKSAKVSVIAASLRATAVEGAAAFERFCALVVEKGRTYLLPYVARSYCELRDADEGIARLDVEAAREMADEALRRVAGAWTIYSGARSTRATVRINTALIAGYRLRAGSLRIDYSIAGRLERLRRELARPLGRGSASAGISGDAARGEG